MPRPRPRPRMPKLLALPVEIKEKILQLLIPFSFSPRALATDVRRISDNMDSIFENVKSLHDLFMACWFIRLFFGQNAFRAVCLEAADQRRLLQTMGNGPVNNVSRPTIFLRLDGDGTGHPSSFARLLMKFPFIQALDLQHFHFSLASLSALCGLQSLRTLSIQTVYPSNENLSAIHQLIGQYGRAMPAVRNLSIRLNETEETDALSCIIKLFERSIEMLSIVGDDYGNSEVDLLGGITDNDQVGEIKLVALKHLNIDFIASSAVALRSIISHSSHLETLSVDCRGIFGFLPLFYVFDLIRIAVGEHFERKFMVKYDTGDYVDEYQDLIHPRYRHGLWKARLSRFYCKIKPTEVEIRTIKRMPDTLELFFARVDEDDKSINNDIRLKDAQEVFKTRFPTACAIKTLVIATESDDPLHRAESASELRRITEALCHEYLPRAQRVTVRWGSVPQFRWTSAVRRIPTGDAMDVDPVWSWPSEPRDFW